MRDRCGCLAEKLIAQSGMSLEELGTLNERVQHLRDALASGVEATR